MRIKTLFRNVAVSAMSFVTILFVQCGTPTEQEFALGNGCTVIPLTVDSGSSTHFLTDYYPQWEGATNVTCADERIQLFF